MYSICKICGRPYSGINCLKCTQQAISLTSFGAETIGASTKASSGIIAKIPPADNLAKIKLADGQCFAVSKPSCRIGHDLDNDIIINDDEGIARFHAQIHFDEKESEYVLRDLGTKTGTFLNGTQIHLDTAIFDGDQLKIGSYKFYFVSDLDY